MEYSISITPIKYHSTVIILLIFSFKMSCVNSDQDKQILHFIKELEKDKMKNERFPRGGKSPSSLPPCTNTGYILPEISYNYVN